MLNKTIITNSLAVHSYFAAADIGIKRFRPSQRCATHVIYVYHLVNAFSHAAVALVNHCFLYRLADRHF